MDCKYRLSLCLSPDPSRETESAIPDASSFEWGGTWGYGLGLREFELWVKRRSFSPVMPDASASSFPQNPQPSAFI
jgi:hypothetical protein